MIAFDTNLLFAALVPSHVDFEAASAWIESLAGEVAISELTLMELYVLVRNSAITRRPLSPAAAVALVERFRTHPRWHLLDAPEGMTAAVWAKAAEPAFGRRRIFDSRLGLSLVRQGVTDFATRNVRDFHGLRPPPRRRSAGRELTPARARAVDTSPRRLCLSRARGRATRPPTRRAP